MRLATKTMIGLSAVGAAGAALAWHRHAVRANVAKHVEVFGFTAPGFESVREAFIENFTKRHELGAGCAVYHCGEKVVDLWGGIREKSTGAPWEKDTLVVVYSTTKGLAAMTLALAHSRGWLDYEKPVSTYWPEFAQNGKQNITVRQLLAHQAGLFAFNETVDKETVADQDRLAEVLARQKPAWEPGTRHGYHAISLGFYENELLRRIDPQHRSLGRFFQDEIATPLGIEFYIRLPRSIPNSRLATMESPSLVKLMFGFPFRLTLDSFDPRSNIYRALVTNPGSAIVLEDETVYTRDFEVPSGGGVGTADSIAKAYGVFASGGKKLGLKQETLELLEAPPVQPKFGFYDECMKGESKFSLGFMKPCCVWDFPQEKAYGHPGAGGSMGFADPENGIGYAYVTNRMGTALTGDPRDLALRNALYAALRCVDSSTQALVAAA